MYMAWRATSVCDLAGHVCVWPSSIVLHACMPVCMRAVHAHTHAHMALTGVRYHQFEKLDDLPDFYQQYLAHIDVRAAAVPRRAALHRAVPCVCVCACAPVYVFVCGTSIHRHSHTRCGLAHLYACVHGRARAFVRACMHALCGV